MSIEHSHGKARPTLPRASKLKPSSGTRAEPQRDALGRVVTSDDAAKLAAGRGNKDLIARIAGRDLEGEAKDLGRAAVRLYRAIHRELPHDGPAVRLLVAAQARSAVYAARYAKRAGELGLDTDEGRAALELSVKLDARSERLAVTALDLANSLAKVDRTRRKRAIDVHGEVARAFGTPTSHTSKERNP